MTLAASTRSLATMARTGALATVAGFAFTALGVASDLAFTGTQAAAAGIHGNTLSRTVAAGMGNPTTTALALAMGEGASACGADGAVCILAKAGALAVAVGKPHHPGKNCSSGHSRISAHCAAQIRAPDLTAALPATAGSPVIEPQLWPWWEGFAFSTTRAASVPAVSGAQAAAMESQSPGSCCGGAGSYLHTFLWCPGVPPGLAV